MQHTRLPLAKRAKEEEKLASIEWKKAEEAAKKAKINRIIRF